MALCLAQRGLNVVLVARRRSLLEDLSAELSENYKIQTRVIDADLTGNAAVEGVLSAINDLEIGLFIACAGFGTAGRLIDSDIEQELNMLDVNCRTVLMMSHYFGRRFANQRRGGIVLMSSLLAFQGVPLSANYAATKAYIQSLAEGIYMELLPLGVDVIASAPGPIHTGFATRANMKMSLALKPASVAQATLDALGKRATVRPGWLSKFLEVSLTILPRWGRVRAMGQVMKGMTQHQSSSPNLTSVEPV
ncbi:MAG: SDR family NAD(P)-dependent oxidoreductase [Chitinophagaceae bacterium]|nr:SDR family NAD(P)-dependent oxidoreductase [Anaerolineae bacterium]